MVPNAIPACLHSSFELILNKLELIQSICSVAFPNLVYVGDDVVVVVVVGAAVAVAADPNHPLVESIFESAVCVDPLAVHRDEYVRPSSGM